MTLHDVRLFSEYAKKHPPLRALVQAVATVLGVEWKEPELKKPTDYMTKEQLAMLMKATGGRVEGLGHG